MKDARQIYRLGLTGFPLGHSLSPVLHASALADQGLNGDYQLYPAPEGSGRLAELVGRLREGELDGLNVTIPHKLAVMPLLDALTASATAIGAVNTLYCREGAVIGDNTDAAGFHIDLRRHLPLEGLDPGSKSPYALVLGAGGSSRAVIYALGESGWKITVAARSRERALDLARLFPRAVVSVISLPVDQASLEAVEDANRLGLVVNTTPLGMYPQTGISPWLAEVPLPRQAFVYDLIYKPTTTRLMDMARNQGLEAVHGLGMLVEQAALAFEAWTGRSPSRAAMWQALAEQGYP